MNREIKFRVFDKHTGKMLDPDRWGNDLVMDMDGELKWYKEVEYAGGHLDLSGTASLVLMQYTGLKDESGKEIYDGDVIMHGTGRLRGLGVVRWYEYGAGFKVFRGNNHFDPYMSEVIGNIHENPELLTT